MSNLFAQLPVPSGNGVGTPVDVSTFGGTKTIVVAGTSSSTVNVEFNNAESADDGSWQSIFTVQGTGSITATVAARWMRARISNSNGVGITDVNVGATDAGSEFSTLDVPAGNGDGSQVDVSSLTGLYKTVQVGGRFKGVVLVEVSVDGDEWSQPFSFSAPGAQSMTIVAHLMRVRRTGILGTGAGLPVVTVGATTLGEGGGGSSNTLQVFSYTVGGEEPDLSEIVITLPFPISESYGVVATCQGVQSIIGLDIPEDLKTDTQFTVIGTDEFSTGDVLMFFAAPKTIIPT